MVPTLSRLEMMASTRSSVMLVPRLKDLQAAEWTHHHTSLYLVWSTPAAAGGLEKMCSRHFCIHRQLRQQVALTSPES